MKRIFWVYCNLKHSEERRGEETGNWNREMGRWKAQNESDKHSVGRQKAGENREEEGNETDINRCHKRYLKAGKTEK